MSVFLLITFYTAMTVAALAVEFLFDALGFVPAERRALVVEAAISWNYTTDIVFLSSAALMLRRFAGTGGPAMLRMMNAVPD